MVKKKVPKRLWDFGLVCDAEILPRMVTKSGDRTDYEKVSGDTLDISEWADSEFYQFVWY